MLMEERVKQPGQRGGEGVRIRSVGEEKAKTKEGGKRKRRRRGNRGAQRLHTHSRRSRTGYIRLEKRLQKNSHRSKDNSNGHISHQDSISKERHL